MSTGLIAEVKAFVAGLRGELPELFKAPLAQNPPRPAVGPRPKVAPSLFSERCAHFAPEMGVSPGKIRVKDMRSLWGSCSYRGDLSFNVRLMGAPPEVLDYVVVHELAHLKWRGHGRRFWDLVQKHCPEAKARRRWLRANGAGLLQDLPGLAPTDAEDPQGAVGLGHVSGQGEVEPA